MFHFIINAHLWHFFCTWHSSWSVYADWTFFKSVFVFLTNVAMNIVLRASYRGIVPPRGFDIVPSLTDIFPCHEGYSRRESHHRLLWMPAVCCHDTPRGCRGEWTRLRLRPPYSCCRTCSGLACSSTGTERWRDTLENRKDGRCDGGPAAPQCFHYTCAAHLNPDLIY